MRHFLTLNDLDKNEILDILSLAKDIKKEAKSRNYISYLKDQTLAMIFDFQLKGTPKIFFSKRKSYIKGGSTSGYTNSPKFFCRDIPKFLKRIVNG